MARSSSRTANAESSGDIRKRAGDINRILRKTYPQAETALVFGNPFELLIATILSAQSTDVQVNKITLELFRHYPDPASMAKADPGHLEGLIHSTGFFRQKAKNLINCSGELVERFDGKIPRDMDDLVSLPGVGRKTAHCVRGGAMGLPAITVDTHFKRLAGRLALSFESKPDKIEHDIATLLPKKYWTQFSHAIILHGRRVCGARKPRCTGCPLLNKCPHGSPEDRQIRSS